MTDSQKPLHIDGHNKLPPKKLQSPSKVWKTSRYLLMLLVCVGFFTGSMAYGFTTYWNHNRSVSSSFQFESCKIQGFSISERCFIIDVRFGGDFSFSEVKLIDLAWDTVIGRGGGLLHGRIFYRYILSFTLVWIMQQSTIPYQYYTSLTFSTVSLPTVGS